MSGSMRRGSGFTIIAGGSAVVLFILAISGLTALFTGFDKTNGGEIAVVRNGGPLDNNKIRQIIDPASSLTWTGLWSNTHKYPAQQRFYTITASEKGGDRPGVDVVSVPTSDGVNTGIEGTIYFTLNLDHNLLKKFDDAYGTRKFRGFDGTYRYPYDGDKGWSSFLDQIVRPVIDNDLREQINNFRCSELVSSCALVQNTGTQNPVTVQAKSNNGNIAKIQSAINTSLASDLEQTLGGNYLTNIKFNLVRVSLPVKVQAAVDDAQAAFAQVTQAQAAVQKAQLEARANEERQKGYQNCPACAQIDELKAIPPSVTTFAPGAGFAITSK